MPRREQDDIDADYIVDEKAKTATLTPHGQKRAEAYFKVENLSDPANTTLQHHINQAIKARGVMQRDVDYVVRDGQVIIVDEFTGRLMFGRRYNEGSASGDRGQGRRKGRAREQDTGNHHLPELLPSVRQAVRHDRYRADRGKRNSATPISWTLSKSDQQAGSP